MTLVGTSESVRVHNFAIGSPMIGELLGTPELRVGIVDREPAKTQGLSHAEKNPVFDVENGFARYWAEGARR